MPNASSNFAVIQQAALGLGAAGDTLALPVERQRKVSGTERKEAQAVLGPLQKLFEKNKAGGWRAEWVRRWWKRSHE